MPKLPGPARLGRACPAWLGALVLSLLLHSGWMMMQPGRPTAAHPATTPRQAGVTTRTLSVVSQSVGTPAEVSVAAPAATTPPDGPLTTPAPATPSQPVRDGGIPEGAPAPDNNTLFLPRSALTLAPVASTPVLLDFPPGVPDGHYATELTLFIDETGLVHRVRMDGPALPAALEAQARQAFLSTRFSPGEVAGRAVRSRIRLAVEFASDAGARPAGAP